MDEHFLNIPRLFLAKIKSAEHAKSFIALLFFFCAHAPAQVASLGNSSISGPFSFRQLQFTTDLFGNITDARAAGGAIVFDGAGRYTLNAQLSIGTQGPTVLTGGGSYSVGSSGAMSIGNPLRNTLTINARLGTEAVVGSTTESVDNTFDLFIAIPQSQSASTFSGPYWVSSFDFPLANASLVRGAFFTLKPNAGGGFDPVSVTGHALSVSNGQIFTQALLNPAYALTAAGSGTLTFGASNNNISGNKTFYVSASGNLIIGGALDGSSKDFFIGVRQFAGTAALANWTGLFHTAGLRFDARNPTTASYVGTWNATPASSKVSTYQRELQLGYLPVDYTSYQPTALNADGTYLDGGFNILGLGNSGGSFVTANTATQFDQRGFSLDFGIATPSFAGSGVYVYPAGVVSAASLSPAGGAVAPGQFLTIFGSGLAAQQTAAPAPFPLSLGGVQVTVNGTLAPLSLVSPTQINAIVPYAAFGSFASVVVTNAGQASNMVVVALAATAPGVFTQDSSGTGPGAILHADGSVVNASRPAKKGETVQIYLTGLGAVSPTVPDGAAGSGNPLSSAVAAVTVLIAGQPTSIQYAGLAPGFPGVYQVNATIPAGLTGSGLLAMLVQTVEGLDEQADIYIQ